MKGTNQDSSGNKCTVTQGQRPDMKKSLTDTHTPNKDYKITRYNTTKVNNNLDAT